MCGIAGLLGQRGESLASVAGAMADALTHRGPDDRGTWEDTGAGIALGHRRLSILDLSAAGHQPMRSACGRLTIAFNGEIYNHLELRDELERGGFAPSWRGHSDTETILAAFVAWGVEPTLVRMVGMFAIALWDGEARALWLARDRLGEKPLYYGTMDRRLAFGSELKALRAVPGWAAEIDRDALTLLLRFGYIPAPYSIYRGIHKVRPGAALRLASGGVEERTYWSAADVAARGSATPLVASEDEAAELLEARLTEAIKLQQIADVPLGAFLSGGIDSTTVVALMQRLGSRPVKTFSIGFHEADYNEAHHAKTVAQHLGTDHTELYVTPEEARAVIPKLPTMYDEPFADSSQIPTYLVSQLARRHVTVSLSGDGGDELFGGYNRYFLGESLWRRLERFPRAARFSAAGMIQRVKPATWNRLMRPVVPVLPRRLRYGNPGDKLHKLAAVLGARDRQELYRFLVSQWHEPDGVVARAHEPPTLLDGEAPALGGYTPTMMYLDLVSYLPDDILVKVDRAAMAVSLETRVPFLDHRVVELAWRIPLDLKVRAGEGKRILRRVLYRHVPRELIERPKMGFGVPIESWLRGPMRAWAEDLLSASRLREEGFFNPEPIRRRWEEHLSGRRNWHYALWHVLMFQAWYAQFHRHA
jgi:asparagine synthase (glutamine-hydrolysing)